MLSIQLGASSALDVNNTIELPLNIQLREVHELWLIGSSCIGAPQNDICVRLMGTPFSFNESHVAGAGDYSADACYFLVNTAVNGTNVQHYGIGHKWVSKLKDHNQFNVDNLRIQVTRWDGLPATYTALNLQFMFTRTPLNHPSPDSAKVINALDNFRGAGRF